MLFDFLSLSLIPNLATGLIMIGVSRTDQQLATTTGQANPEANRET